MGTLTLYTCADSRGLRATWLMEEMGLAYELAMLPFPPRSRAPQYLEINPLGTVPALRRGDALMTESCAIVQFLATAYGPSPLAVAPDEPDYAMYLDWLHHAEATLTFPQTVFIRFARMEKQRGLEAAGVAYADWFGARLAKAHQALEGRDYLCAGRFTAADIAVGYALYLSTLDGLSEHLTPVLRDYLARITARPAFAQARAREHAAARALAI
jgi:glutathione S-transferase